MKVRRLSRGCIVACVAWAAVSSGSAGCVNGVDEGGVDGVNSASNNAPNNSAPNNSVSNNASNNSAPNNASNSASNNAPNNVPNNAPNNASTWYRPPLGTTWQLQLTGELELGYDVDLYELDLFDTPDAALRQLQGEGRRVICYLSAGSWEEWRDDADAYPEEALGEPLDDWPGERWVDIRSAGVREVLAARLDVAAARGCDGVEPDNVDGYTNATGFPLTAADQLAFNRWLAAEAHARGLTIGLKNSGDQAAALVEDFDYALNEECHAYEECEQLVVFIQAGKPVFNVEYAESDDLDGAEALALEICPDSAALGLSTLVMPLLLDGTFRVACE